MEAQYRARYRGSRGMRSQSEHRLNHSAPRAFTLVDVMVSIGVLAVLIALLLPSLSTVQETARRVVCRSNVRQIGLGVAMYAQDNRGYLPPSIFALPPEFQGDVPTASNSLIEPHFDRTMSVRLMPDELQLPWSEGWDGLGLVYKLDYVHAVKVFYCPSHTGEHPYRRYALSWDTPGVEVVGNYQYRGNGPSGQPGVVTGRLDQISPQTAALISDGMQTREDYNHLVGANLFRADLSVVWFDDAARRMSSGLSAVKDDTSSEKVETAWEAIDESSRTGGATGR